MNIPNKTETTNEFVKKILADNKKLLDEQSNTKFYLVGLKKFIMECEALLLQWQAFIEKLAEDLTKKGVEPTGLELDDLKNAIDQGILDRNLRKELQDKLDALFRLRDQIQQQLTAAKGQLMQVQGSLNQMISTGLGAIISNLTSLTLFIQNKLGGHLPPHITNSFINAANKAHDIMAQHGETLIIQIKNGQNQQATDNPTEFLVAFYNQKIDNFNHHLQLEYTGMTLTEEEQPQLLQYQAEYNKEAQTQFTKLLLELSIPILEIKEKIAILEQKIEQYQEELYKSTQQIEQLQLQLNNNTLRNPPPESKTSNKLGKEVTKQGVEKGIESVVKEMETPTPLKKF